MAISGLSEYGGLYNNYRVFDIPKVDIQTVQRQDEDKKAVDLNPIESVVSNNEVEAAPDLRTRTADLQNISLTFNQNDDYSYLGSDSDLFSLDMDQMISDMKKDKILEDYQYFVGSYDNNSQAFSNEDGKVVIKL